jgi:hypothetical protein
MKLEDGEIMNKQYLPITLLTLISCSTVVTTTQKEEDIIERVNIVQKKYIKPDFYLGDVKSLKKKRKIASVEYTNVDQEKLKKLSNRQIYFLNMYKQYKQLAGISGQKTNVNSCPSFHNVLLENKSFVDGSNSSFSSKMSFNVFKDDPKAVSAYPIMALPYSKSEDLYSKLKRNNFENGEDYLSDALTKHFKSQEKEIAQLCDQGVSPGYYIYENLVTYFNSDKSFHSTKAGLKALLKVPVLANMVILDNLKQENYAFNKGSRIENWLLQRSNTSWFKNYIFELNDNRNSHLSSNLLGEK